MDRKWLEKFYGECGREVSLAYNVLNQSNNWGITLGTAILAGSFIGVVEFKGGQMLFHYPTIVHWFYVIVAWIIMVRFFVRSALGLNNMYRWNELITAISKVLSLPEGHPALPVYLRNCAKRIDTYFYRWKSPKPTRSLIWHNLKLMYLWFFLIILALFVWGLVVLDVNLLYFVGIGLFVIPTVLEAIWFSRWYGLQYEKIKSEAEPDITRLWKEGADLMGTVPSDLIVLGFCEDGPFKHAVGLLKNPSVKWIPWSYHIASIDPAILNVLSSGHSIKNHRVAFACCSRGFQGQASVLRFGQVDHCTITGGILRLTVNLEDLTKVEAKVNINLNESKTLCFYSLDSL